MADVTAKGLQDKIAEAIEKQKRVLETLKQTAREVNNEQQRGEQGGEQRGG
jgi:phage-related tail protein